MRTKSVLILPLFFYFTAFSQTKLEFGDVIADTNFSSSGKQVYLASNESKFWKVQNILQSKNELEIRFYSASLPHPIYTLVILTYDGGFWNAQKFTYENSGPFSISNATTIRMNYGEQKIFDYSFNQIFDTLKQNNIFLLPDQKDLNAKSAHAHDGGFFSISFKAGEKFRQYSFSNPDVYAVENPDIRAFTQFLRIIQTMNSILH